MNSVELFFLGIGVGVFLYSATSLYRLVMARRDVLETWDDRDALAAQGAEAEDIEAAGREYNQAAEYYNDRLHHVPSNLFARFLGYVPAPLLKDDGEDA